ncbi:MAG: Ig-like domain-containing protein, partial [Clostridiales bacterium]|nr:Ig-like domain-containing protein [Clostridiales bacterium]
MLKKMFHAKRLLWLLCLLLAALSISLAAGCKDSDPIVDDPPPDGTLDPGITLSKSELQLDLFTDATLTAELKDLSGAVVWTSDAGDVAAVSGGKVTALKVGSAVIKAAVGDYSASCRVTVVRGNLLSGFSYLNGTLNLMRNRSHALDVAPFDEDNGIAGIAVTFTPANADNGVFTVSAAGNVTAIGYGSAALTVAAVYAGETLVSKVVTVNVVKVGILSIDDPAIGVNNDLNLKSRSVLTAEDTAHAHTLSGIEMSIDGEPVPTPTFTYASADPAIASVDANGVIIGQKAGATTVTVSFSDGADTYDRFITVNVANCADTLSYGSAETDYVEAGYAVSKYAVSDKAAQTTVFTLNDFVFGGESDATGATVSGVRVGAENLTYRVDESDPSDIKLCVEKYLYGETVVVFTAGNIDYTATILIADYVLTDFAGWTNMLGGQYKYMVLDRDITYAGGVLATLWYNGDNGGNAFRSTLNGLGHTVKNAKVAHGLFTDLLTTDSVVKNIRFENLSYKYYGAVGYLCGTFENVFMTLSLDVDTATHGSMNIIGTSTGVTTFKNCAFLVVSYSSYCEGKTIGIYGPTTATVIADGLTVASAGLIARPGEIATYNPGNPYCSVSTAGTPATWNEYSIVDQTTNLLPASSTYSRVTVDFDGTAFAAEAQIKVYDYTSGTDFGTVTLTAGKMEMPYSTAGAFLYRVSKIDGTAEELRVVVIEEPDVTPTAAAYVYADPTKAYLYNTSRNGFIVDLACMQVDGEPLETAAADVRMVVIGGTGVDFETVDSQTSQLKIETSKAGEIGIRIICDSAIYDTQLLVVDYVLTDFTDWKDMVIGNYQYAILESDLTYTGNTAVEYTWDTDRTLTFDGRGHTVKNAIVQNGLFNNNLAAASLIKNVTFENLTTSNHGALGADVCYTVENCHFTLNLGGSGGGDGYCIVANKVTATGSITNSSFIVANISNPNVGGGKVAILTAEAPINATSRLTNVVIGTVGKIARPGEEAFTTAYSVQMSTATPVNWTNVTMFDVDSSDVSRAQLSVSFSGGFAFSLAGTDLANSNTVKVENLTDKTVADDVTVTDNAVSSPYVSAGAKLLRITSGHTAVYLIVTVTEPTLENVDVNYGAEYVLNTAAQNGVVIDLTQLTDAVEQDAISLNADEIDAILVDGFITAYTVQGDTVKIGDGTILGEVTIKLNTADRSYILQTVVTDYVLTDFANWGAMVTGNYKYAILASDLTYTGSSAYQTGGSAYALTFDGRGHTVKNAIVSGGLFYTLTAASLIKNVTFENLTTSNHGALGANVAYKVENCHFTLNLSGNGGGDGYCIVANKVTATGSITNSSFIVSNISNPHVGGGKVAILTAEAGENATSKLTNVVIGTVGNIARPGEMAFTGFYSVINVGTTPANWTNVTMFDSSDISREQLSVSFSGGFTFSLVGTALANANTVKVENLTD